MNWLRENMRVAIPVLLTLAVPLLLVLYFAGQILSARLDYQREIDNLEPRIARLQGLVAHEQELREAARTVGSDMTGLVFAAFEDESAVAATLQKNVRELFADAGLNVTNSQIVPVREGERFDRVAVKLTVAGGLAQLDVALAGLGTYLPRLMIEDLDIWPTRSGGRGAPEQQEITATVQVLALKGRA